MLRLLVCLVALSALAGCVSPSSPDEAPTPRDTPLPAESRLVAPPRAAAHLVAPGLTIRTDSLLVREPVYRYRVDVAYPQLAGSSATVSVAALQGANRSMRDSVRAIAGSFRPDEPVLRDTPGFERYVITGGFDTTFLDQEVFSALVHVAAYTGGAHEKFYALPFNVDLRTGAAFELEDLFRPETAWADTLSVRVEPELLAAMAQRARRTPDEARAFLNPMGYTPRSIRLAPFTLSLDSLALHFVPYAVAGFVWGGFDVSFSYADLAPLLRPDGVAGRLHPTS